MLRCFPTHVHHKYHVWWAGFKRTTNESHYSIPVNADGFVEVGISRLDFTMPCVFGKGHALYNANGGGCWTLHHYHFIVGLRALWLSLEAIVLGHGPMT